MFDYLCLTLFLFVGICSGLEVRCTSNGTVETYVSTVKLEGLSYSKRAVNFSVPVSVKYEIKNVNDPSVLTLSWERDGNEISVNRRKTNDKPTISSDYTTEVFSESTHTLELTLHLNPKDPVPGNYTVSATEGDATSSASGFVYSAPVLPLFTKPKRVLEGDIIRIICSVSSYPKASSVLWSFAPIPTSQMDDDNALTSALDSLETLVINETNYVLETSSETGTPNDTLRFLNLKNSDNGLYACNVTTELGTDFVLSIVNVKDRWAALWPFIGIVVEVSILVIAILLYERHQMRSKPTNVSAKCDTSSAGAGVIGQENISAAVNNNNNSNKANSTGQNNLTVPVHIGDITGGGGAGEVNDGNADGRDQKADEIRLRANVKQ